MNCHVIAVLTFMACMPDVLMASMLEKAKEEAVLKVTPALAPYTYETVRPLFTPLFLSPRVDDLFKCGFEILATPENPEKQPEWTLLSLQRVYGNLWGTYHYVMKKHGDEPLKWDRPQLRSLAYRILIFGNLDLLKKDDDMSKKCYEILGPFCQIS